MIKNFFGNLLDILCLTSCGIFACIVTKTVPVLPEGVPQEHFVGMGAALFFLLIFRRLTKMVWNAVYCICTIALAALLLEWATKGVLMPPVLRDWVAPYTMPALLEGACYYELVSFALLWLMGALCCHGFWRVTSTALLSYAVWLILSLMLHIGAKWWMNMDDAPLAEFRPFLQEFPWVTAAFPACLIFCYAVLLSMFDALFLGWPSKKKMKAETAETAVPVESPAPAPAPAPADSHPGSPQA